MIKIDFSIGDTHEFSPVLNYSKYFSSEKAVLEGRGLYPIIFGQLGQQQWTKKGRRQKAEGIYPGADGTKAS